MSFYPIPQKNDDSKSIFDGGGDKPATEKQIAYIMSLARKKKADLVQIIGHNFFEKLEHDTTGSQANKIIRTIKDMTNAKRK
ncbi:MAG: hypothetical protein E7022_07200 [Desulfovibrio desulfuricans]|nr:hypothetical protein [Desulfovibrio desulfuricans]